ncbi:hypothetical protein [Rosistilla oblonga]|uniref:hypothetical protein n=1 Tax=Rosistilla oblonga TaxID=2527990 RepID=UPI003A980CE7
MGIFSKLQSLFTRKQQPSFADAEAIVEKLIALGFLKFTPETSRKAVRQQLIESVRNNYLESEWDDDCVSSDRRSYSADAEDLAEGDVGNCLRQMSEVLSHEGVILESVEDVFTDEHKRYEVSINRASHLIYDLNETSIEDIWLVSFRRLVGIVNSLLIEDGSSERLFGLYGGNDARVILLTESMHDLIRENTDIFDEGWIPMAENDIR